MRAGERHCIAEPESEPRLGCESDGRRRTSEYAQGTCKDGWCPESTLAKLDDDDDGGICASRGGQYG